MTVLPDLRNLCDGEADRRGRLTVALLPQRVGQLRADGFCTVIRLLLRNDKAGKRAEQEVHQLATSSTPVLLFLDRIASLRLSVTHPDAAASLEALLLRQAKSVAADMAVDASDLTEVDLGDQGRFVVATRAVAAENLKAAIIESSSDIDSRWESWSDDATVSVATQLDSVEADWRFYTFLPMKKAPSPLAAHANAPFFTKLDRNSVSFEVYFNDFLLTELAALCVDTALWIRDNAPAYSALCVDLTCWSAEYLEWLAQAFADRGIELSDAELIPIASQGSRSFGAVTAVRTWGPFDTELTRLTADSLTADTDAMIVDPQLGEARIARFRDLRSSLNHYDDGNPSEDELAEWVESSARALSKRRPATEPGTFDDFIATTTPWQWRRRAESPAVTDALRC